MTNIIYVFQDLRSNAPILYFWYAEAEIANSSGVAQESEFRALHILSCLGSGTKYKPYECSPSKLQLLRAHQGFKEIMRNLQSTWTCGTIEYSSIALVCAAALFEELTTGWASGTEILHDAFTMVLPGKVLLFIFFISVLFQLLDEIMFSVFFPNFFE